MNHILTVGQRFKAYRYIEARIIEKIQLALERCNANQREYTTAEVSINMPKLSDINKRVYDFSSSNLIINDDTYMTNILNKLLDDNKYTIYKEIRNDKFVTKIK